MTRAEGRCLCGDVTVHVTDLPRAISACHCTNCRRWSGSVQMGIAVPADRVTVWGPVKTHRSSRIAERAWCDTCGSALWLRDVGDDADYELVPGLFDDADLLLERVVYADRAIGFELGGDPERVSAEDYEKKYPHLGEGEM